MSDARKQDAAIDALRRGRTEEAVGLFREFLKSTGFCSLGLCANRDAEWECCANHFRGRLLTLSLADDDPDCYELARGLGKWIRDRHALEAANKKKKEKKEPPPAQVKIPDGLFIGHPSIDFDHLKLAVALSDIAEALKSGRVAQFPTLLNSFLELQAMHFKREEDILAAVAFPHRAADHALHNRLRERADGLVRRVVHAARADAGEAAREGALAELTAILFDDIRDSDLAFKSFLQRQNRILF